MILLPVLRHHNQIAVDPDLTTQSFIFLAFIALEALNFKIFGVIGLSVDFDPAHTANALSMAGGGHR